MRKAHFLLLIFFVTFYTAYSQVKQPAPPKPDYQEQIDSALTLIREEFYQGAVDILKDFPENDTSYCNAMVKLSLAYLSLEEYDNAIKSCEKCLEMNSEYRLASYEITGSAYDAKKDYDKAIETFRKGMAEFPNVPKFWYHMAVVEKNRENYEASMHDYEMSIRLNPYHASSHLNLGLLMFKSGRMVPALLAFQTYLLMDQGSSQTVPVLVDYEKIGNGDFRIDPDSVLIKDNVKTGDFEEMETIVKSKIALNPKYKTNVKIPYNTLVKTMQIIGEKITYNESDTSFFMQFYVPILIFIRDNNMYDTFIYYCFRNIKDPKVSKEIKKQSGSFDKFETALADHINKYRQKQWMANKLISHDGFFFSDGQLNYECDFNEAKKAHHGPYKSWYDNGELRSVGQADDNGDAAGKWEYYSRSGLLDQIKSFKNGMVNDSVTNFHTSGMVSERLFYKDDKLQGVNRTYYRNGVNRAKITFKDDKKDGKSIYYHTNGQLDVEVNLVNEKAEGKMMRYYSSGQLSEEYNYTNDKLDGPAKYYHEDGSLKSEGLYKNDLHEGEWKYYYIGGIPERKGTYKNGKEEGLWKSFLRDGTVSAEYNYTGGELEGESKYYDYDGKLWSVLTFSRGRVKKYLYYDKSGKVIAEGVESKGTLKFNSKHPNGNKFREYTYVNGLLEGKNSSYNAYGNLDEVENYKNGNLEGVQYYYYDNGSKKSEITYKEGVRDGFAVEYYIHGNISDQGWYENGDKRGIWYSYHPDGTIESLDFYQNDEKQGRNIIYNKLGRPDMEYIYHEGEVQAVVSFDTLGNENYRQSVIGGAGEISVPYVNGKTCMQFTYKNGRFDGEMKKYYANGKPKQVRTYEKASLNGPYKNYDWQGNVTTEGQYDYGYATGTIKFFNEGKPESKTDYHLGKRNGESFVYYQNGNTELTGSYVNGNREGYFYYFAENGEVKYRLFYVDGDVVSYSYLNPDSNYVEEIPLPNSTGTVEAFYRNGNKSAVVGFKSGYFEGEYTHYHPNGKISRQSNFVASDKIGKHTEYDSNGLPVIEENYYYDLKDGECKYYEKGVLRRVSFYHMDDMHGPTKIYDKTGKLVKTVMMYCDEPYN